MINLLNTTHKVTSLRDSHILENEWQRQVNEKAEAILVFLKHVQSLTQLQDVDMLIII